MKTLNNIKNTTDIVKVKEEVKKLTTYRIFNIITQDMQPEMRRLNAKQEMTLDDFVTIHKLVFNPVSHAVKGAVSDDARINAVVNGILFGVASLHDVAPRLATWYIDIICNPEIAGELPIDNAPMVMLDITLSMIELHHYFANVMSTIICHHRRFADMPQCPESVLNEVNEFRRSFVEVLSI